MERGTDGWAMMRKGFRCRRDELVIRGYEYRTRAGMLPAVILSHGYLANQNMCRNYAELIARLGYAAFTFDFSGGGLFSESDGKSENMTVETETQDLKSVIKYVRSLPDVDGHRIVLLGCSQGGTVSALVSKDREYRPEKLILLYPALCIPDDARAGKMMFARFDSQNIPDVIQRFPMKLGGNYARCAKEWSLRDIAGDYDGKVLLLHGTADRIVPIRYSREAAGLYEHVEYHEIDGGEHMFRGKHDRLARAYIESFLSQRSFAGEKK